MKQKKEYTKPELTVYESLRQVTAGEPPSGAPV